MKLLFIAIFTFFGLTILAQKENNSLEFIQKLKVGCISYDENPYIYFKELYNDYGILITDNKYDDIDVTYYELFYKKEKYIYQTSEINLLKKKLKKLPKGTILDWYDTCTMSQFNNLSEEKEQSFINLCKDLNIKLFPPFEPEGGGNRNMICTCKKMKEKKLKENKN